MMSKTEPIKSIKEIKIGSKDSNNYTITEILAKGNEFAIYEIDHNDITTKLRVLIDGLSDESEANLTKKFAIVKQKYIVAKGLLYRSQNYGMMKNRIAHTLASIFNVNEDPSGNEFDSLIDDIKKEHRAMTLHRISYIAPSMLFATAMVFITVYCREFSITNYTYWQFLIVAMASSLGGSLSILLNAKELHFEEYDSQLMYAAFGLERLFLACAVGCITFILIKAKILFPEVLNSYWSIMSILIATSFSETFIPSVLKKLTTQK